jgi:hypothetical protein
MVMIAQRFRPVGWVAGVATAATVLYMISLQVASERGRLEAIDRKIAATHRDIRQLQTEIGTRASLRQLERWNGEVLALSAPNVEQYLAGEHALDSVDQTKLGTAAAPPPVMVAVGTVAEAETREKAEAEAQPALLAVFATPKPKPLTAQDHAVQQAIKSTPVAKAEKPVVAPKKPVAAKLAEAKKSAPAKKSAAAKVAMLDRSTLNKIAKVAKLERGGKPRP